MRSINTQFIRFSVEQESTSALCSGTKTAHSVDMALCSIVAATKSLLAAIPATAAVVTLGVLATAGLAAGIAVPSAPAAGSAQPTVTATIGDGQCSNGLLTNWSFEDGLAGWSFDAKTTASAGPAKPTGSRPLMERT